MKKRLALIVLGVLILTGGVGFALSRRADSAGLLGLDPGGFRETVLYDDYGGVPHEGRRLTRLTPEAPEELAAQIDAAGWDSLPLTEEIRAFIYGGAGSSQAAEVGLPRVEGGSWKLVNRGPYEVAEGRTYNFTLAIYDAAGGELYVYEIDT